VAVSEQELRRVASLARLALPSKRIPALLAELNGILEHMSVLARVDTSDVDAVHGVGAGGMRLRADDGPQYPLAIDRERFAPETRDGLFLVPRLATHGGAPAGSAEDLG